MLPKAMDVRIAYDMISCGADDLHHRKCLCMQVSQA